MEATSSILPFRALFMRIKGLSHNTLSPETSNYPRKISDGDRQPFLLFMVLLAKKKEFLCTPQSARRPYGPRSGMLKLPAELTWYSHGLVWVFLLRVITTWIPQITKQQQSRVHFYCLKTRVAGNNQLAKCFPSLATAKIQVAEQTGKALFLFNS